MATPQLQKSFCQASNCLNPLNTTCLVNKNLLIHQSKKVSFKKTDISIRVEPNFHQKRPSIIPQFHQYQFHNTENYEEISQEEFLKDNILKKYILKKRSSNTRHLSLIYASRNKYVLENEQSNVLTKILRPERENDHNIEIADAVLRNIEKIDIGASPLLQSFGKSSMMKLSKNQNFSNFGYIKPENSIEIHVKETILLSAALRKPIEIEDETLASVKEISSNVSPIEKRINEWLDQENVIFVIVDKKANYNEKLLMNSIEKIKLKKKSESDEVMMSPMLRRRAKNGLSNPVIKSLRLNNFNNCSSSDNLLKVLNVELEIN